MILFAVLNSVKIDKGTRLRIYISSQQQSVKSHETADLRHKSLVSEGGKHVDCGRIFVGRKGTCVSSHLSNSWNS